MSYLRHLQKDKCELFGFVGYIVQGILAIAALLTLIIKRCQEKPKRPWKVWWFDVSKQVIAALVLHIVNLILSSWLTNDEDISDECVWYFVTLFLDCTLGAFLSYILMWVVDGIAIVGNCKYIKSGLYFEEYVKDGKRKFKLIKKMYFAQLTVWLVITIINKLLLLAFVKIAKKFWENFGNFILTPFTNANVKLVVVMIIFPVILNALYFWVSDNILKFDLEDGDKDLKKFYMNNNQNKTESVNNDNNNEISNNDNVNDLEGDVKKNNEKEFLKNDINNNNNDIENKIEHSNENNENKDDLI
jgi:hypothetical protein